MIMPSQARLADAFEFAKALRLPEVRAEIARRGYVSGTTVIVGRDTPVMNDATFRVWRDSAIPGGWTGAPATRPCPGESMCTGGLCFESDFTDECVCPCHRRSS